MSQDVRKICPVCAWRANCAKRFSMSGNETLHCPDFSEDISLRKKSDDTKNDESEENE
jgi:hypothetical protein